MALQFRVLFVKCKNSAKVGASKTAQWARILLVKPESDPQKQDGGRRKGTSASFFAKNKQNSMESCVLKILSHDF